MKLEPNPVPTPHAHRKRGMALVMVVSLLALLTMLMLATVSVTDSDFKAESASFEYSRARMLADSAVAIAQAKLVEATSQRFDDGTPKPWTSQPGAIRVHSMDGALETLYKLYSAPSATTSSVTETAADLPDDWAAQKESFVDLNAPQRLPGGDLRFPIADPRAMTEDPLTNVEGFAYEEEKGAIGPGSGGEDAQRLPMPVRWIYMLADGTLGTLTKDGAFEPRLSDVMPSRDNPITGRFAWWVDDETSKVNVNTAAEGSFWDVPVADTAQERCLAMRQPTRLEYSRQPGHPAGVCLSSVLLPGRRQYPYDFSPASSPLQPMTAEDARDLWRVGRQLSADNDGGTSFGGFRETDWAMWWPRSPRVGARQSRYATTDELVYDTSTGASASGMRVPHSLFSRHPEAAERLPRSRFFLTTCSTAPELTLFGTPRVALWPVHASTLLNGSAPAPGSTSNGAPRNDTGYDHKVADVATLNRQSPNRQPYFVQRSEPGNGANDFEGTAQGANKKLFLYLQRLTNRRIPGFYRPASGFGTFAEKYGGASDQDRDAILIEMLDYIRACNFSDGQLAKHSQFSILCPGVEHKGFGQVAPMQPRFIDNNASERNHPQGMGRVLTMSEIALVIVCRAEVDADGNVQGEPSNAENGDQLTNPGDRELEVGLLVEGFVPGQGWADYRPYANVALFGGAPGAPLKEIDGDLNALPKMWLNNHQLEKEPRYVMMESPELPPMKWQGAGGSIGIRSLSKGLIKFKPIVVKGTSADEAPELVFMGGSHDPKQLKVALYDAPESTSRTDLLQVVPLKLPDILPGSGIRLPRLPLDLVAANPGDTEVYSLENRMRKSAELGRPVISSADIVQSLAPLHGDYRLTATQRWSESRDGDTKIPVFVPHPGWGRQPQAHTLCDPTVPAATGGGAGYISTLSYAAGAPTPDMPAALRDKTASFSFWDGTDWKTTTLLQALDKLRLDGNARGYTSLPEVTGDFDNGTGNAPDGPYSSRPDDGNWASVLDPGKVAYFDGISQTGSTVPPVSTASFSAQRLLPSPVVFGSLPTGARAHVPWQTLLFRPQTTHYGHTSPPDHLLLDLFWSPVIEPEPLGLGLESEGKINLNHQMLPFRHIKRTTALHAALKAETITAIPDSAAGTYKTGGAPDERFRHYIDAEQTLRLWQRRVFDAGNVFLTASEICDLPLVPEGMSSGGSDVTVSDMNDFWAEHRLTGDNTKERPYSRLYSRFTTRSNTYRIHFVAQSLKKARSTPPGTFDSTRDQVTATHQGSKVLRRTLDMENREIPDYLSTPGQPSRTLEEFYTWSIGGVER